jgi:hypothetical protein
LTKRVFKTHSLSPNTSTQRSTEYIPSRVTSGGSTAAKSVQTYTGDKMVGIAIIHKSCLQPVFSRAAAEDTAKMRR